MPYRWQINASSVAKLIGAFKLKNDPQSKRATYRREELAKTWANNLKRMPRFGVQPSTTIQKELAKRKKSHTTMETVEGAIQTSAEMKTFVHKAVVGQMDQRTAIKAIVSTANNDVAKANEEVSKAVEESARAAENVIKHRVRVQRVREMRKFNTVKAGVKKTRSSGWFYVERDGHQNVYHMSPSGKSSRKSSLESARSDGWVLPNVKKVMEQNVVKATSAFESTKVEQARKIEVAEKKAVVAKNISKVATKTIQTTKGVQSEDRDLAKVQKKAPTVREGNRKAYFYSIFDRPYGAFVIGYIDGFDPSTGTVIELKHRSHGLFKELREYERIQCFVYMKMLKVKRAKLIETYQSEQREYVIEWDNETWRSIENGIVQAVHDLNAAERDVVLRNELIDILM